MVAPTKIERKVRESRFFVALIDLQVCYKGELTNGVGHGHSISPKVFSGRKFDLAQCVSTGYMLW